MIVTPLTVLLCSQSQSLGVLMGALFLRGFKVP